MTTFPSELVRRARPIIFDAESVRTILAGRKTQTRRVLKPQPEHIEWFSHQRGWCARVRETAPQYEMVKCPYGQPGHLLYAKETWSDCRGCDGPPVSYKATGDTPSYAGWKSPRFMPRWASRLTLRVVSVRVERLQAISEGDAIAEGVDFVPVAAVPRPTVLSRRADFAQLWDRINAKRGYTWASNPWVWVVEFEPCGEVQP